MPSKPPPEWPFRCPGEGWYLSNVEAETDEYGIVVYVTGTCKRHGIVAVTDPRAYAPHLWNTQSNVETTGDPDGD